MSDATRHSPGPLAVAGTYLHATDVKVRGVMDDATLPVARMVEHMQRREDEWRANAARLALCWNMHDDLVAALKTARDYVIDEINQCEAARGRAGLAVPVMVYREDLARIDAALAKASPSPAGRPTPTPETRP
jgi:hypothetical protein